MSLRNFYELPVGTRVGIASAFFLLGVGGLAATGYELGRVLTDGNAAASADRANHPEQAALSNHARSGDQIGAGLGTAFAIAAGVAGAVSLRGAYGEIMRTNGQWYWETVPAQAVEPAPLAIEAGPLAAIEAGPLVIQPAATIEQQAA